MGSAPFDYRACLGLTMNIGFGYECFGCRMQALEY